MSDTLEEILQDKLINEIFPSFSEDHKKHLIYLIRLLVADWLTKKRQEITDRANRGEIVLYMAKAIQQYINKELLEELK